MTGTASEQLTPAHPSRMLSAGPEVAIHIALMRAINVPTNGSIAVSDTSRDWSTIGRIAKLLELEGGPSAR